MPSSPPDLGSTQSGLPGSSSRGREKTFREPRDSEEAGKAEGLGTPEEGCGAKTLIRVSNPEAGLKEDAVAVPTEPGAQGATRPHGQGHTPGSPAQAAEEGFDPSNPTHAHGDPTVFYSRTFTCLVKTGNEVYEKQHPTHTPGAVGSSCGLSPSHLHTAPGRDPQARPTSCPTPAFLGCLFSEAFQHVHGHTLLHTRVGIYVHACTGAPGWAPKPYAATAGCMGSQGTGANVGVGLEIEQLCQGSLAVNDSSHARIPPTAGEHRSVPLRSWAPGTSLAGECDHKFPSFLDPPPWV